MQSNNNSANIFQCFCKQRVDYSDLTEHIKNCQHYHNESPFYKEFKRLPIDRLQEVHLVAIHQEFNLYQEILQEKLAKFNITTKPAPKLQRVSEHSNNSNNFDDGFQIIGDQNNIINANPQNNFGNSQIRAGGLNDNQKLDPLSQMGLSKIGVMGGCQNNKVQCGSCGKKFDESFDFEQLWYLQQCCHLFCKICLTKQINTEFIAKKGDVPCKQCGLIIDQYDIQMVLGQDKTCKLNEQLIAVQFNIIKCVNCKQKMEFQPGNVKDIQNIKMENGKQLTRQAAQHYSENRFVCLVSNCKTEQCKQCQISPYHVGYTCEEYQQFKSSKRCRYCDQQINKPNLQQGLEDICDEEECIGKAQFACSKKLGCGHNCYGVKGEQQCLPCLEPGCAEHNHELNGQTGEDYCNICFIEGISAAPAIRAGCGHIFHYHCVKKKLELKWPTARITFNFSLCPLCKSWLEFPPESDLYRLQQKNLAQLEDIKKKTLERLKHEERMKDEKLINPQSPYYQKPLDYGMAIYAYYECYKCKTSYFGGHKDCQQAMDEGNKEFNSKELICANCCEIPIENCPKHGKDFIEFKCKFCCSIAQWFCWGTTHFCDPCHKKQCAGDYVSKYPVEKLPKCGGKQNCPLKVDHKPNGQECSLGCSVCRNVKENAQKF